MTDEQLRTLAKLLEPVASNAVNGAKDTAGTDNDATRAGLALAGIMVALLSGDRNALALFAFTAAMLSHTPAPLTDAAATRLLHQLQQAVDDLLTTLH